MNRSLEKFRLAANLLDRAAYVLETIDHREVPGLPGLRNDVRGVTYDSRNLAEASSEIVDLLNQEERK